MSLTKRKPVGVRLPHYAISPTAYSVAIQCKHVSEILAQKAHRERQKRSLLNLVSLVFTVIPLALTSVVPVAIQSMFTFLSAATLLFYLCYLAYKENEVPSRFFDHEKYVRYYGDTLFEILTRLKFDDKVEHSRLMTMRELALLNLQDIETKWPWCKPDGRHTPWLCWNLLSFNEVLYEERKTTVSRVWILTSDLEPDISDETVLRTVCKNLARGTSYVYFFRGLSDEFHKSRQLLLDRTRGYFGSKTQEFGNQLIDVLHLDWPQLDNPFSGHSNFAVYWQNDGSAIGFQEVLSFRDEPYSGGWRRLNESDCEKLVCEIKNRTNIPSKGNGAEELG